jgi:hypothetical protein
MTQATPTQEIDPKIYALYDEYCHGAMDRREFLAKAAASVVGPHLFTQKGTLQPITCDKLSEACARGWCLGEGSAGSVLRSQGTRGHESLSR